MGWLMRWCVPDDALCVGTSKAAILVVAIGRAACANMLTRNQAMEMHPWR